jgi:hypothetical protein
LPVTLLILHFFELTACVTGFVYWKNLKNTYWKSFPFYLLFICFSESLGYYCKINRYDNWNRIYFNYFEINVEFIYSYMLFYFYFKNDSKLKWLPIVCIAFYLISFLSEMLLSDLLKEFIFLSLSYTIGNLLLLLLVFSFFFSLMASDEILNFKTNMLFWVSLGLLIFYVGSFPYFGLVNYLAKNYPSLTKTYHSITLSLDAIMYGLFAISFILGRPQQSANR